MVNYPYETNFIGKLPAWPVLEACKAAAAADVKDKVIDSFDYTNITRLAAMFDLTYNYEGGKCFDMNAGGSVGLDTSGWTVQTCSQFPMPQGDDPSQSCFTWNNWYEDGHNEMCRMNYGYYPKYFWALDYFGGRKPSQDFADYSKIVFFNGDYDPWHGGGVNTNITRNTIAVYAKRAAHHYDLRGPNANDTKEILEARAIE